MGPIGRCCLWYCSGIMFVGVIFFAILILMEATGSEYLKPHNIENFDYPKDSIMSLLIAIAVSPPSFIPQLNLIAGAACCFCIFKDRKNQRLLR